MKARQNIVRRWQTIVAVAVAFVSLWVVISAGVTAVWLTDELRVAVLVTVPAGIVASLLVLYFAWRGQLERRTSAERDEHRRAA